jgi:hypothetical protein
MPTREQQTTNKQHAVPQNIMDVEFKLIGDLTMRQFIYILVFALMAYMARLSVPQPFTWFFVVGIALAGLALAFIPIEDRGLDEWAVNFVKAIYSPTERIWRKRTRLPQAFAFEQNLEFLQQEMVTLAPTASRRKLEEYLDTTNIRDQADALDIPEKKYLDMVKEAFKETPTAEEETPEKKEVPPAPKASDQVQQKDENETPTETKERKPAEPPKKKPVAETPQTKMNRIIKSRMSSVNIQLPEEDGALRKQKLQPMSEHAGRKFLNLTPGQGQIVLPIRGEKVLKPAQDAEDEYRQKNEKLQALLNKGETDESGKQSKTLHYKKLPPTVNKPNIVAGTLKNRKGEQLEDVVLAIKNQKGETVRAVKTNKLGRFMISTPLPNGEYQIEVDKRRETTLSFDIIPLSAQDEVLPFLEIIGY